MNRSPTNALFLAILEIAKHVIRDGDTGPYSTGESLAGVLAAGDVSLLKKMHYTFEDAVARLEPSWQKAVFSRRMKQQVWHYKLSLLKRTNA